MARACCTNVQAKNDVYNKGGHSVLEATVKLTYKPRTKIKAGPKPAYKILRSKKTKKRVASAFLHNIEQNLNESDTLDNKASHIRIAATKIITKHLTPPPNDNPIDSLPDHFSERTKRAIREREREIMRTYTVVDK